MNETRFAGRVGAFVVAALILVATLLLVFSKGMTWFTPTYTLRLRADNVGGLKPRSAVLISGVAVGSVAATELAPDGKGVNILLRIHTRYGVHRDARFVVEQVGLLGDQYVVIYPTDNKAPLLKDGDEVDCAPPFNLQEVARSTVGFIQRIDQTARELNEAITRVNHLLLNEQTLTNMATGIEGFRLVSERAGGLVERLDRIVSTNTDSVSMSMTNLVYFSEELKRLAADLRQTVSENRTGISATVSNLEDAARRVGSLAKDLQAGQGVAGSLLKDEQLQANLSNVLANLAVTASNVANYGLLYKPKKPKSGK
jgi:phospholipid/cholesterol/gamma-HCH transport system substrate-binding protein